MEHVYLAARFEGKNINVDAISFFINADHRHVTEEETKTTGSSNACAVEYGQFVANIAAIKQDFDRLVMKLFSSLERIRSVGNVHSAHIIMRIYSDAPVFIFSIPSDALGRLSLMGVDLTIEANNPFDSSDSHWR